jgi:dTDP-glucose 4,6-dehydratase
MARLLVTGGAGFIGANFVRYWLRHHPGDAVVVLDALTYAGNRASLPDEGAAPDLRFVHGDIGDRDLVEGLLRDAAIDTIVHFAAESHVDRSIHGPERFVEVNVVGTLRLLEAARGVWSGDGGRFHHVSTDEVYGTLGPDDPAFTEHTPYAPNSPYAASKAAADHLVRAYHETYGLAATISNCSNNYGPFHYPEKLIPLFVVNLLEGRDLPVYGAGANVRDWLHVEDHCRGIERILESGRAGEVYNIGSRNERDNLAVVEALCAAVDDAFAADPRLAERFAAAPPARGATCAGSIRFVRDRPGHDLRYAIDPSKVEGELGFAARVDFTAGLRDTVRWYLDNERWWRAILERGGYREWLRRQYGDAASGADGVE